MIGPVTFGSDHKTGKQVANAVKEAKGWEDLRDLNGEICQ